MRSSSCRRSTPNSLLPLFRFSSATGSYLARSSSRISSLRPRLLFMYHKYTLSAASIRDFFFRFAFQVLVGQPILKRFVVDQLAEIAEGPRFCRIHTKALLAKLQYVVDATLVGPTLAIFFLHHVPVDHALDLVWQLRYGGFGPACGRKSAPQKEAAMATRRAAAAAAPLGSTDSRPFFRELPNYQTPPTPSLQHALGSGVMARAARPGCGLRAESHHVRRRDAKRLVGGHARSFRREEG